MRARLLKGLADNRLQIPQMFARGQFGDDAAVFGMQLNLRRDDVGENAAVLDYCRTGFVTRSFNPQDNHILNQNRTAPNPASPRPCRSWRAFRRWAFVC